MDDSTPSERYNLNKGFAIRAVLSKLQGGSFCAEGISQAGMPAFQSGAVREHEKAATRISHVRISFSYNFAPKVKLIPKPDFFIIGAGKQGGAK